MSDSGTDLVPARWTYTRTEGSPDARYTDWTFERPATESNLKILLAPVLEMRNLVRLKIAGKISVEELTKTIESCTKYGGCPHHPRKGGPCKINTDLGLLVSQNLKKAQMETLAEKLKRKREAQQNPEPAAPVAKVSTLRIPTKTAAPAVKLPPRNPVSPPEAEEVMTVAIEEDDLPPVSGEVEDLEDTTPAPPPKRGRPKGTTTKVSAKEPAEVDNGAEKRYFLKEAAFAFAPTRTAEDPEVAALECAVFGQQLWEHIQGD
jgi:hypothetical protein